MRVSGFSFIRNAVLYDYPIKESICSILPLCDEFIIAVGDSDDGTLELVKSIGDPKIKIVETTWDPNIRTGGHILAIQTNIALSLCTGDWCFYLQSDEVVHENELPVIHQTMTNALPNKSIQGLVFSYNHFWGSYKYTATSRKWYRHEVRIIRNRLGIQSHKDAQGFRCNGKKLMVIPVSAHIYHYGWVKSPETMMKKYRYFNTLWHSDKWISKKLNTTKKYDYSNIDSLTEFSGSHPAVMQQRILNQDWEFNYQPEQLVQKRSLKLRINDFMERKFNFRVGEHKNYIIIKTD